MALPRMKQADSDVHEWEPIAAFWRDKEAAHQLPTLCVLARKHLATPASSIYSERLFSQFGNIYEKKRSRLLPSNARMQLFLTHNYARLDKHEEEDLALKKKEQEEANRRSRMRLGAGTGSKSKSRARDVIVLS